MPLLSKLPSAAFRIRRTALFTMFASSRSSTSGSTSASPSPVPLTWDELSEHKLTSFPSKETGPVNSQSLLRTFGRPASDANRVTLYRDNHYWCPYCQKIALYLEEHRIPYRVRKVTMFCYGDKESWYKKIVPSGMLPALELDGQIITESDDIIFTLDQAFGPLHDTYNLGDKEILPFRKLERKLFSVWCDWLCRPNSASGEARAEANFKAVASEVDQALSSTEGPFFLGSDLSVADVIFTPYIERMSASLYYYKGFALRDEVEYPKISAWFNAMEQRTDTYLPSDFHTHSHDLPPQMGMCVPNGSKNQIAISNAIDGGMVDSPHFKYETSLPEPDVCRLEALTRMLWHRETLVAINPVKVGEGVYDEALRAALTNMIAPSSAVAADDGDKLVELVHPPKNSAAALRYLRDRINVPRDMSLHAARALRIALEQTAALDGGAQGPAISSRNRRDQNSRPFVEAKIKGRWHY